MDWGRLIPASCWVFLLLHSMLPAVWGQSTLQVVFTSMPANLTSDAKASFRFTFRDENGVNPCGPCAIECKLDNGTPILCSRNASYSNLSDGRHAFEVTVNTSDGKQASSKYNWVVDTTPPTASLNAGPAFTNALNITVEIIFSEPCSGGGGFLCASPSTCDLKVIGAGVVLPSTLKEIQPGIMYSILVALSTERSTGRVILDLARNFCSDAVGNRFKRDANSSRTIHFDRRPVFVNLWTAVPDSQIVIGNLSRTLQATNKITDIKIYLDFTQPVSNSSKDLLDALEANSGILEAIRRKSHGNRRFGFQITNITAVALVTVSLRTDVIVGRAGTPVTSTSPVTFLYDSVRPEVKLTTSSLAKARDHNIVVLVQFTKPVFLFSSSTVEITGGNLTSFEEVSKSTYVLNAYVNDKLVSISVPENSTTDIAGNFNLPSNIVRVRHYSVPAVSVALYSFTTAGFLATSFAAGALAVSSASLAAAGALTSKITGSVVSDPSRNLLGMAGHLQVFALSDWLAISLPIEYHETTQGLQWLIPHVRLPWVKQQSQDYKPTADLGTSSMNFDFRKESRTLVDYTGRKDVIWHPSDLAYFQQLEHAIEALSKEVPYRTPLGHSRIQVLLSTGMPQGSNVLDVKGPSLKSSCFDTNVPLTIRRRKLGVNATLYGPSLSASDYQNYFLNGSLATRNFPGSTKYTGWHDFGMNMFWLGAAGGFLILLHLFILGILRWRTRTSLRGALSIPRFEFFLLIFALPSLSQALAFVIRGGTTGGIIVGVMLLAIPASFLLSVILFLLVTIFVSELVQYKEIRWQQRRNDLYSRRLLVNLIGPKTVGKWIRKEGLSSSFIPRFGLIFEDRKGPPKFVVLDGNNQTNILKWVDSGSNGIGRMRAVNSDDESEDTSASRAQKALGVVRAMYVVVDLVRRVTFGLIFGAYPRSDDSWSQVSIVFGFTVGQLLYLMIFKPYIRRGVQLAETICLACEAAVFAAGLYLVGRGHPTDDHKGVGIFMIVLLFICFVVQLINEWYALMNQLLRLAPSQEPSLKLGLKMFYRGLLLPFIPRRHWSIFITPQRLQPKTGLVPVVQLSPEVDVAKTRATTSQIDPTVATVSEAVVPAYGPGSPCFIDPRTVSAVVVEGESEGSLSGEIRAESSQRQGQQWNQWGRPRSIEGKRSRGTKADPKSNELKMLRELAKASFPRGKKDESGAELAGSLELTSTMASPSSLLVEPAPAGAGSIQGRDYSDDSSSDDESKILSPRDSPMQAVPPAAVSSGGVGKGTGQAIIQDVSSTESDVTAVGAST